MATNALLERKGERCCLVTSKGFADLLHIGNQARPAIFDLEIRVPDTLYERTVEVDEQVPACACSAWNGRHAVTPCCSGSCRKSETSLLAGCACCLGKLCHAVPVCHSASCRDS